MDHAFAIKFQACEKYVLGELSPELRDAYEEHFFSCAECAIELRGALDFAGAARKVFASEPAPSVVQSERPPIAWLGWLRPAVAVPAFAILLALLGYQNLVTIPRLQNGAGSQVLPMFSLITANTRGEEASGFTVRANQPFGVYVDIPYDAAYAVYTVRLESPTGASLALRSLSLEEARKTQVITINPGSQSGRYAVIVAGLASKDSALSSAKELARLQFSIELQK